jgi:plasmid stabilization system protein ParE
MEVRWSAPAARDLELISKRILRDDSEVAREVAQTIYDGCATLRDFPRRGRAARIQGKRERVFLGLPYIVLYRTRMTPWKFRASIMLRRIGRKLTGHRQ